MANERWRRDIERRNRLALLTAEQCPDQIARRIVVIDNETTVRETVIFEFDSRAEANRKERNVLLR